MATTTADTQTASEAMRPLLVVCILYIVLDVFFVTLRFASRFIIRRSEVGWDDYLILPAFLCNVAACAAGLLIAYYESIGDNPANAPIIATDQITTQLEPTMKLFYASIQLLIAGFTFPKLSILTLYLRIFTGTYTRLFAWLTGAFVLSMGLGFGVAGLFLCSPVQYFWDKTIINGQCVDLNLYYRAFCLPNVLVDVAMIITPLPAIWGLQASVTRRLGITLIFLTGTIGMVVSCVRWSIYAKADVEVVQPDVDARLVYISIIECSTYLIAACLPASYPALNALVPADVRRHFQHVISRRPTRRSLQRPTVAPEDRHSSTTAVEQKRYSGAGFAKLMDSPVRSCSPSRSYSPFGRPDSRKDKYTDRNSVSMMKNSPLVSRVEREDDNLSMNTHARSQSRAETVRKEEDEETAMAEFRRLAGEHRVPTGEHGGLIAVHTEIEVTQEERIEKVMGL